MSHRSALMPPKRPRITRAGKREEEAKKKEESKKQAQRLASVLVPVTQNGWFNGKDLCRLERTGKTTKCQEEVWKALCCNRWPKSVDILDPYSRMFGSYRQVYRHRSASLQPSKKPKPLSPPQMEPEQAFMQVSISIRDVEVYSTVVSFDDSGDFVLKEGVNSWSLRTPYVLGNASCWMSDSDECTCNEGRCHFKPQEDQLHATIHLIRTTDFTATSCCIFDPPARPYWYRRAEYSPIGDLQNGVFDWKDDNDSYISFHRSKKHSGLSLRQTAVAAEIKRRLPEPISFDLYLVCRLIEPGDKMAITRFQIGTCIGKNQKRLTPERSKKYGVTLLHLFEQLQGIDDSLSDESENDTDLDSDDESDLDSD